jgi:hypothetical protein
MFSDCYLQSCSVECEVVLHTAELLLTVTADVGSDGSYSSSDASVLERYQ